MTPRWARGVSGTRAGVLGRDAVEVGAQPGQVDAGSTPEYGDDGVGIHEPVASQRGQLSDGYAMAGDDKAFTPVQSPHDLAAVVPELPLGDVSCHGDRCKHQVLREVRDCPALMRGMTISRPIKGVAIVGLLEPQATFTSLSSTHADQSDQVGETTSMPACDAAEQRRSSYATRAVRLVFTDKALAKWIASRLRSSVGARDAAFSMTARSTGSRSMPLSNRLAPSTEPSSTRRQVRRSSTVDKSLLTLGTSSLADSHSTKAALSVSSNTSFTNADVSK